MIGAALLTAGAGCKKSPKPPTLIPGNRPGQVADGTGLIDPVKLPDKPTTGPGAGSTLPGGLGPDGRPLTGDGSTTSVPINPSEAGIQTTRPDANLPENRDILKAETLYYDLDRATVRASERPKLDRVATYLKNTPNAMLKVEGHCDERGTEDYNRSLGERRALAAREYLVNSGIAPERVTTVTLGEDQPAETGHDEAAWSKNRRAEFIVLGAGTGLQ